MARVNVEDSLFRDTRFLDLCNKLGSSEIAIGALVLAWCCAQEYWKNTENGIPITIWEKRKFRSQIIECGMAEIHDDFVYMCGSKKGFEWLNKRKKAGQKGGGAKKSFKHDAPKDFSRNHYVFSEANESKSKPLTLTPSLSLNTKENTYVNQEKKSEIKQKTSFADVPSAVCAKILQKIWNENRGKLPEAKHLDPTRERIAKSRLREFPDENYWIRVAQALAESPFCNGGNKTGWQASFDFFLKADTHIKALEGQYSLAKPEQAMQLRQRLEADKKKKELDNDPEYAALCKMRKELGIG